MRRMDDDKMKELRFQKLQIEKMIMEYNLDLIDYLEKDEDLTDRQKGYLSKELTL